MSPRAPRAVRRWQAVAGLALLAGVVAGVVAVTEALRHPPAFVPAEDAPGGDPRAEIQCPEQLPVPRLPRPTPEDAPPPATAVTSGDLYDCPAVYDGARVRYEGEVVGALMPRRGGTWTQLNDDVYATELGPLRDHHRFHGGNSGVGVRLPADVAAEVDRVGGPRARGDVLTVTGTFYREHGPTREVAVIIADQGVVTSEGERVTEAGVPARATAGGLLLLVALAVALGERFARGR